MSELITRVFSLRPIRSNLLPLPLPHFKDTSGERLQKRTALQALFTAATESQSRNAASASLQLFVLKLVVLTSKRFLMSFSSSLYLASLLSSSPALALPLCFLLCLRYPSSLSSPGSRFILSFTFASGLQQRSLNHIRAVERCHVPSVILKWCCGGVSVLMF